MNRRDFLAVAGCACCAGLLPCISFAQGDSSTDWQVPPRIKRPDVSTDEGGLWSLMDREEQRLRKSPFLIQDAQLQNYIQEIACRLGGEHCPDVRVYLLHTPLFNANMAPNGMMQVWSGLLLRADNEAQLAAVLGHEFGHYLARHSIEQLRDAKSRSAFAQFISVFGLAGTMGAVATVAGSFAYTRDHERMADRIGLELMSKAGYDPTEAAKIWQNLLLELKAKPGGDPAKNSPMFATHPPTEERYETLARLAEAHPGGVKNESMWQEKIAPFRREWLADEVKRGQHEESIALLTRKISSLPSQSDYLFARAEVYRNRAEKTDYDEAVKDYLAASAAGSEPPETYRGLGMIYRSRKQIPEARASFEHYLKLAPDSPDALMIKSYIERMGA
jgi:beta-barrel assembly-enhancing protease